MTSLTNSADALAHGVEAGKRLREHWEKLREERRRSKWQQRITESDIDFLRRLIEFPPAEVAECDIDYLRRLIDDDIDYPMWLWPTGRRRHPQSPGQNPEGLPVQHPTWEGLPKCDRPVLSGCDQPALFKCACHRAPDLEGLVVGPMAKWR